MASAAAGNWSKQLLGLYVGSHQIIAKIILGDDEMSEPRTFTVTDELIIIENFDNYSDIDLEPNEIFDLGRFTISGISEHAWGGIKDHKLYIHQPLALKLKGTKAKHVIFSAHDLELIANWDNSVKFYMGDTLLKEVPLNRQTSNYDLYPPQGTYFDKLVFAKSGIHAGEPPISIDNLYIYLAQ